MAIRNLQTAHDVILAIGRPRVIEVTRKRTNNLSNWLASGHFPPETFYVLTLELRRRRCRAPLRLWRMIEPHDAKAA